MTSLSAEQVLESLNQLQQQVNHLTRENQQLSASIINLERPVTPTAAQSFPNRDPKVDPPPRFNGNRRDYLLWKDQLDNFFQLQPQSFPDDARKIAYIYSRMSETAAKWLKNIRQANPNDLILCNIMNFWQAADAMFVDSNRVENARARLERCVQTAGSSTTAYATRFKEIAVDCQYDSAYLLRCFRKGLRPETLIRMSNLQNIPTVFEEYVQRAILEDDREYNLQQELKSRRLPPGSRPTFRNSQRPNPNPVSASPAASSGPAPMEIGAVTANPVRKLTQDEKLLRRKNGQCLYCGIKGHFVNNCPAKSSKNLQVPSQ